VSVGQVACIRGILTEILETEIGLSFKYKAEEGHEFIVPRDNIAYLEVFSDEFIEEVKRQEIPDSQGDEINKTIQSKMKEVEEQFANKSTDSRPIEKAKDSNSEFVF
jgi:hypothetical protein